jgi:hypothetical protein
MVSESKDSFRPTTDLAVSRKLPFRGCELECSGPAQNNEVSTACPQANYVGSFSEGRGSYET